MRNTKFYEELIEIQNEYMSLLKLGLKEWEEEYFVEFIAEINLFWKRKEAILFKIYEYEFPKLNTVFLTAVTKVDLEYLQHYSMKITGSVCLIDDPLISYLNLLDKDLPKGIRDKFSEVIQNNIKESLELFETCSHDFFILPIRTVIPMEMVTKAAEQFFVSLFEDVSSLEDYFSKISTFEDIEDSLKDPVKDWILFGWGDEQLGNLSFKNRFLNFVDTEYRGNKNAPASEIFFISQIGYLSQGMNILFIMSSLEFVPYIRGEVPFRYLTILYTSLKTNLELELDPQIIRTMISYLFERIFDFKEVSNVSYNEYLSKIKGLNLYQYVEEILGPQNKELYEIRLREVNLAVRKFYEEEFLSRF